MSVIKMFQRSVQQFRYQTQKRLNDYAITLRGPIRSLTAKTALKVNGATTGNWENAKPYSAIPAIGKLEMIRAAMPGGALNRKSISEMLAHFWRKYGDIYKMPGMFGTPETLVAMAPADFAVMFRNEGKWPDRRPLQSMAYFREVHRKDFFQGTVGIAVANGEPWAKARTAVNPILMQPKNSVLYLDKLQDVNEEFLARIRDIRDPESKEMPANFEDDLTRLTLESVLVVALDKQLGIIRKNRDAPEIQTIIEAIRKFFELSFSLEVQPGIWRYVKTRNFNEMMKTQNTLLNVCTKYIDEAIASIENKTRKEGEEKSLLEKLIRIDKKMATVMALDMISAGVDTSSSAIFGTLLCLSKNPDVQQKLFDEIIKILPEKNSKLTIESMRNLPYLRACIKEALRIHPVVPGTVRKMPVDVVMSGYQVPKGTDVIHGGMILMLDDNYVPSAKAYRPERFLRHDDKTNELSGQIDGAFIYLPFGFGPRICVGKRIVNMEMEITIARLVRNFHIEYNYPTDNAFTARFINVPNLPMKFKFSEREH